MLDNRLTIDSIELLKYYNEEDLEQPNEHDVELLHEFYECLNNVIVEKDFDSFYVSLYMNFKRDELEHIFDKLIDISDKRFDSFVTLVREYYQVIDLEYIQYPSTLQKIKYFILDKYDEYDLKKTTGKDLTEV